MNKLRENFPKNVIEVKKKLEKNLKKVAKEKIDIKLIKDFLTERETEIK